MKYVPWPSEISQQKQPCQTRQASKVKFREQMAFEAHQRQCQLQEAYEEEELRRAARKAENKRYSEADAARICEWEKHKAAEQLQREELLQAQETFLAAASRFKAVVSNSKPVKSNLKDSKITTEQSAKTVRWRDHVEITERKNDQIGGEWKEMDNILASIAWQQEEEERARAWRLKRTAAWEQHGNLF